MIRIVVFDLLVPDFLRELRSNQFGIASLQNNIPLQMSMLTSLDNDDVSYSMAHSQNYNSSASKGVSSGQQWSIGSA